jgi:hypothetical protein
MNNDWHEAGDMPPIGFECESKLIGEDWGIGRLTYCSSQIIVWRRSTGTEYATRPDARQFRPIKSEREKAIDAAVAVMQETSNATFTDMAEALYKAGLLRAKPDA